MKKILSLITLLAICTGLAAQEKTTEINSKVTEATVYINGAFLKHEANVKLQAGKTVLRFTGISPYYDKNSVRVSAEGEVMILGVHAQLNIDDSTGTQADTFNFDKRIRDLSLLNEEANVKMTILSEKENFLQTNKVISSAQVPGKADDIVKLAEYYDQKITELRLEKLKLDREVRERVVEINSLRNQQQFYRPVAKVPEGEVLVTVSSKVRTEVKFDLRYFTDNANWFPSYDIRVDEVGKPVQLVYKATVRQQTGTEWKDVKLRFSNATPRESGLMPQLNPYYLDYEYSQTYDDTYRDFRPIDPNIRQVSGKIYDASTGEGLPMATVQVEGTSVGTVSDFDGNFSLSIPTGGQRLVISYIGYERQILGISSANMNIAMSDASVRLDAVVVNKEISYLSGVSIQKLPSRGFFSGGKPASYSIPVSSPTQTKSVYFEMEIDIPYTVSKEGKPITIDLKYLEVPAFFEYQAVPKLDQSAYLFAGLVDWEQYQLLDGEANVYFENTFVGKTVLNPTQLTDTMLISLGQDKGIIIQRTKVVDRVRRQLIGKDRIESLSYETIIRNTKAHDIRIKVFEQYPLARSKDIGIELSESSGGKVDEKTGTIVWEISIPARSAEKRLMEYTVKYPKERRVYLY